MKIRLFVNDGYAAFVCQGLFEEPIKKVRLVEDVGVFAIQFLYSKKWLELDCPIDQEAVALLGDKEVCAFGYAYGDDVLTSEFIMFEKGPMPETLIEA